MIESHYQTDFGRDGRVLWANMLVRFPVDMAMKGVTAMVEYPLPANRSKPQVADLRVVLDRLRWRERSDQPAIEQGKYGVEAPEWVWVWSWARFSREPRVETAFPQQRDHVDPAGAMLSTAEYDALKEEWVAAGSPRSVHPIPTAV